MSQLPITDERLIELAQQLPAVKPDREQREAVRTSLLSSVDDRPARRPVRRWVLAGSGVAMAAGLLLYVALGRSSNPAMVVERAEVPAPTHPAPVQPTPARRAVVEGSQAANFTHERTAGDEVVALKRGTLRVRVADVKQDERFRVVVGDAQVEATASAFDVEAGDDGLRAVHVRSGRVQIRVKGHNAVFLSAGQSWRATEAVTETVAPIKLPEPAPAPASGSASASASASATRPAPGPTPSSITNATKPSQPSATATPAEQQFKRAWHALRDKHYRAAAAGFERAIAGGGSIAQDARYWRAVALLRAGDQPAGRAALESFLVNHPSSARVGEVSAMLGWLHVKAGRRELARGYFKTALTDSRADVRKSARAGLAASR